VQCPGTSPLLSCCSMDSPIPRRESFGTGLCMSMNGADGGSIMVLWAAESGCPGPIVSGEFRPGALRQSLRTLKHLMRSGERVEEMSVSEGAVA
jgi:hypothetical protein